MNTVAIDIVIPAAKSVTVTNDTLAVELGDGRSISVLLAWFPRLIHAPPAERKNWRLIGHGRGIHWETLDEDINIDGLLSGKPSGEIQASFKKLLSARSRIKTRRTTTRKTSRR